MTAALRDGIARVTAEAGGAITVYLVRRDSAATLLAEAADGDWLAATLLRGVAVAGGQIIRAPRHKAPLCLCCPRPLRRHDDLAFAVVLPAAGAAITAIGCAICERCASAADLDEKILGGLREIWPGLRQIVVTDPAGGRA